MGILSWVFLVRDMMLCFNAARQAYSSSRIVLYASIYVHMSLNNIHIICNLLQLYHIFFGFIIMMLFLLLLSLSVYNFRLYYNRFIYLFFKETSNYLFCEKHSFSSPDLLSGCFFPSDLSDYIHNKI